MIHDVEDIEPEDLMDNSPSRSSILAKWLILFLLYLQAIFHVSDAAFSHLFRFLKAFLTILGQSCATCAAIAVAFPSTLS